jgi:glycosyltransferase involved in cell wall biosynthesis
MTFPLAPVSRSGALESGECPATIHMMTASLSPGDAICNYILSLVSILREWNCSVNLYTDYPNALFPVPHHHTSSYRPTGSGILWFHYSIYSDNIRCLRETNDYIVFDSHNVSPAHLFHGYDQYMEHLCAEGERLLDDFAAKAQLTVVHSEYVREDLRRRGYRCIYKVPLVVDTKRFTGSESAFWSPLLGHLTYLLFVGRIVPQKDVAAMLHVFSALKERRADLKLFLIGGQPLPRYLSEMHALAAELRVSDDVILVGSIVDPAVLTSFYRHARFYLALSQWESFCVPIIEALYFGTPVAGRNVPPIPEIMNGGGFIVDGGPEEIAAQIDNIWDNEEAYGQFQANGRSHAEHFTDASLRDALTTVFRAIV